MRYLVQNSKIEKTSGKRTFNFGIPALRSVSGVNTCPNAGACATGCYALMGAYVFKVVRRAYLRRLKLTLNSDKFRRTIRHEIDRYNIERVRIHDSGDFYSLDYFLQWVQLAKDLPHVEFYAYSKMVSMIKKYTATTPLPVNFKIIFSLGGKEDRLIDQSVDRHSRVFASPKDLKAAGYADASKDDAIALASNPKVGLVYHGTKLIDKTNWNKVKTR